MLGNCKSATVGIELVFAGLSKVQTKRNKTQRDLAGLCSQSRVPLPRPLPYSSIVYLLCISSIVYISCGLGLLVIVCPLSIVYWVAWSLSPLSNVYGRSLVVVYW
jgi:hypothetical protein